MQSFRTACREGEREREMCTGSSGTVDILDSSQLAYTAQNVTSNLSG